MCKWKMKASIFVLTAVMTAACGMPGMVFADDITAPEGGSAGSSTVTGDIASGGETNDATAAAPDVAKPDGGCPETGGSANGSGDSQNQGVDAEEGEKAETLPEGTKPSVDGTEITEPEITEPDAAEPETTVPEVTEPETTVPEVTEPNVTEPEIAEPEITEPGAAEPAAPEAVLEELPAADAVVIVRHIITSGGRDYIDEAVVKGLKEGDVAQASDYARMSFKGVEYVASNESVTLAAGENLMELRYVLSEGYQIAEK